ncbi:hypothetical protein OGAPHI_003862 [Ogataea philodendri]|uniref:Peroxisomal membrane protein PEX14 n=1 Tax=Ogataea philodendri TaxID=1378263 RepID=A0A9P8T4W6_9ASCO|nr:uncharacterized protein OGAPHI_003862 [Ogataea philodendri]KAH3665674.1 hypothetical protein OGAPHI_003862 [Ogataea philodendri]
MSQQQPPSSSRADLVASAAEFLLDKSIADSPLAKKIEFLESKGLTQVEVEEALQKARLSSSTTSQQPVSASAPPPPPIPDYYRSAPPLPERDWKDYFIMATATAGVSYAMYQIIKRYVVPRVLPPSKTLLEQDKASIDQEFQRVESLLEKFEADQKEFFEEQKAKSSKIDETLHEIDEIISKTNEKNLNNEETLKYLKLEIENIKTTLLKTLDGQKATLNAELSSMEKQIQDIKFDIRSTGVNTVSQLHTPPNESSSAPSESKNGSVSALNIPPATSIPSMKDILSKEKEKDVSIEGISQIKDQERSIPAWQLAAANGGSSTTSSVSGDEPRRGIPAWQLNA